MNNNEILLNTRQKKVVKADDENILCLALAAAGKALPNSIKIPTQNGIKSVGEIRPGDTLFDRHGKPTKVLQIFPQGELEVYKITFGDGRVALCSKDHIWAVNKITWRNKQDFREYTVEQLLKEQLVANNRSSQFFIPCSAPIEYSEQEYKVHPYVIGAFLGDGCCLEHQLTFSSENEEIPKHIANLLGQNIESYKLPSNNYSWTFYNKNNGEKIYSSILPEELLHYSYEKSIPKQYKYGSIEQRLELIRGLMDTDGSISKDPRNNHSATASVKFTSTSINLINDVKEILGSLGYVSTIHEDNRKDKYTNKCYELNINISNQEKYKLFSLSRKKEIALSVKDKKQQKRYDRTSIRSIEKLNYKEEMTCFLVDNEEHLFLMNDFIVTHNTRVLTERIKYLIINKKVAPSDIVAITFTNQAAAEMYARLGDIGQGLFIGTIHSYANKVCLTAGIPTDDIILEERYDDLLSTAISIPRKQLPHIKHLLVDECQDIGELEFKFLTYLNKDNQFFIGDENQMIYGFKGTTDKYLRDMYDDYNFAKYYLVENYRNAPNIIKFAESFINPSETLSPASVAVKTKKGYITECPVNEALEDLEDSGNWGAWFIIARTNKEVDVIIDRLKSKEIPYVTFKRAELDLSQLEALMTSNAVKVMTIHTAKGLESPNVIVVGAKTYCAEERRIAYVAATRAETNLYWCPAIKKIETKGKKYSHWTKTKRVEQSIYGDIIEF